MVKVRRRGLPLVTAALLAACRSDSAGIVTPPVTPPAQNPDTIPLRSLAALRGLRVGAAIDRGFRFIGAEGTQFRATFTREFSMLTPENDMKHDRIHPARATYRFEASDSLVAFAQANGMLVRGHTLVWHQQLARWLTSTTWTTAEASTLLTQHVADIVSHFRGKLSAWDVVNEPLADNGALRAGFWLDNVGASYIELAFRAARAADPDVALYINDYNIEGLSPKSDSMYALVQRLVARRVPITGVGFESHYVVGGLPTRNDLATNLARYGALGLKVQITELDIRLRLPSTAEQLQTQAQNYRDVFGVCLQSPACNAVVTWGVTDRESWVPSTFPGWGDALLFDTSFVPKPAFRSVYALLAGR
ncbi:MAG: endo-1,4-beta-xylanase [Gemmatimonadaceae bacterium]